MMNAVYKQVCKFIVKKYLKRLCIILSALVASFVIVAIIAFVLYQNQMKDQFNQTVKVIQPIYTELQEKYNHNLTITEAKTTNVYHYTFEYKGELKKQIQDGSSFSQISCDIFSDIQNKLDFDNKYNSFNEHGYRFEFQTDQTFIYFNYGNGAKEIQIVTNSIVMLESLSKIRNVHKLDLNPCNYTNEELENIKKWCLKNNVEFTTWKNDILENK
jgi:hypothetical protein